MDLKKRRDPKGPAGHHEKKIPLQFVSRELREAMGQEVSGAHFWREVPRISLQAAPESRPSQGFATAHTNAADRTDVRSQLQRSAGPLPGAFETTRRRPVGIAKR